MKTTTQLTNAALLAMSLISPVQADDTRVNLTTMLKSAHVFGNGFNNTHQEEFTPVIQNALTVYKGPCFGQLFTSSRDDNVLNQLELFTGCSVPLTQRLSITPAFGKVHNENGPIKNVTYYDIFIDYKAESWSAQLFFESNDVLTYESIEIRPTLKRNFEVADQTIEVAASTSYNTEGDVFDAGFNSVSMSVGVPLDMGSYTIKPEIKYTEGLRKGFKDTPAVNVYFSWDF